MAFKTLPQSNPFRYDMKEPYPSATCVFKLWFGPTHYLILKAKALHQALQNYSIQIDRDLRNGVKEGSILFKAIKWIHVARPVMMTAEMIYDSDDPLELLKAEHRALKEAEHDKNCLNVYFSVAFPKWIPNDVVIDFQKWLTSLTQEKRKKTLEQKKALPADAKAPAKKTGTKAKDLPAGTVMNTAGKQVSTKVYPVDRTTGKDPQKTNKRGRRTGSKDTKPRVRRTREELTKVKGPSALKKAIKKAPKKAAATKPSPAPAARKMAPKKAAAPKILTARKSAGKVSTKGQQPAQSKRSKTKVKS